MKTNISAKLVDYNATDYSGGVRYHYDFNSREPFPIFPPEIIYSGGGVTFWEISTKKFQYLDPETAPKLIHAYCPMACVVFDEVEENVPAIPQNSTVEKVTKNRNVEIRNWSLLAAGTGIVSLMAWVMLSGVTAIFIAGTLLTYIVYNLRKDSRVLAAISGQKKTKSEPEPVFPTEGVFPVVRGGTFHYLIDMLQKSNNDRSIVNLLRSKLEIEFDHASLVSWVDKFVEIYELDENFPLDAIPLMNDKMDAVHEKLVQKVAEKKRVQEQLILEANQEIERQDAETAAAIAAGIEHLKKFAENDSELAESCASDYIDSL